MKKTVLFLFLIISAAAAVLPACGKTAENDETGRESQAGIPEEYITVPAGVSAEMLDAEYWIPKAASGSGGSGEVIMTAEEISAINSDYGCPITAPDGSSLSLDEIGDELDGAFAAGLIKSVKIPKKPEAYFLGDEPTDRGYWEDLYELKDVDSIPEVINVRFGFSVQWSTLRSWPTRDRLVKNGDLMFDEMISSDFRPFEPLAVIHESADQNWYYCIMAGCGGWIEKECVALCEDRDEWINRQQPQDILVVTGDMITLSEDPYDDAISGISLPMGTKLELVRPEDAPERINGRTGYGCFTVKIPVRDEDGSVTDRFAYIPVSEDVNAGFPDLTREAVIRQAFRYIGNVYGWGGDLHSVDCSGLVRSVFSCFGLRFPRTAAAQEQMPGFEHTDLTGKTDDEKAEVLRKAPAGSLLFFNGHVMIWLGEESGDLYVISSASMFGRDENGADEVNTVTVNSLKSTYRPDGTSWISNLASILIIGS